jgi:hypothetical protein
VHVRIDESGSEKEAEAIDGVACGGWLARAEIGDGAVIECDPRVIENCVGQDELERIDYGCGHGFDRGASPGFFPVGVQREFQKFSIIQALRSVVAPRIAKYLPSGEAMPQVYRAPLVSQSGCT